MKESSDGGTLIVAGRYRPMIPDLRSSRGERNTSKIGFYPGHLEERLTGGTQRTTGLMVRYVVVKVSRLLCRKDFTLGWRL